MLPVAILAGGLGTRLGAISAAVPKILIDVAGRPFAEHQLDWLQSHGVRHVVYCLGHLGEQVVAALGDGSRFCLEPSPGGCQANVHAPLISHVTQPDDQARELQPLEQRRERA